MLHNIFMSYEKIPNDLVEDTDILNVLEELIKDSDVLAICYKCEIPLSIEEYEQRSCTQCGNLDIKSILYVYHNQDLLNIN